MPVVSRTPNRVPLKFRYAVSDAAGNEARFTLTVSVVEATAYSSSFFMASTAYSQNGARREGEKVGGSGTFTFRARGLGLRI